MLPRRRAAGSGSSSAPFLQSCDALLSPATLALAQRSLAATPLREVCESSVSKSPCCDSELEQRRKEQQRTLRTCETSAAAQIVTQPRA